jgi:hypothetical protein
MMGGTMCVVHNCSAVRLSIIVILILILISIIISVTIISTIINMTDIVSDVNEAKLRELRRVVSGRGLIA